MDLIYACRCNPVKRDQTVGDPLNLLHAGNVAAGPDGSLTALDVETRRLIRHRDLNTPRIDAWRYTWTRIVALFPTVVWRLQPLANGLRNVLRIDSGRGQQLGRGAGGRHGTHR